LELKEIINQQGISLICFTSINELKAEEFIRCFNYAIEGNITFEEVIRSLNNQKNKKIHLIEPLQTLTSLSMSNLPKYKLYTSFIRNLITISQTNNLSIILKSYAYTSVGPGSMKTAPDTALYGSNFVGIIDKNKIIVEKSRYSEIKEYDLDGILLRNMRKKKLENIEKIKTS